MSNTMIWDSPRNSKDVESISNERRCQWAYDYRIHIVLREFIYSVADNFEYFNVQTFHHDFGDNEKK